MKAILLLSAALFLVGACERTTTVRDLPEGAAVASVDEAQYPLRFAPKGVIAGDLSSIGAALEKGETTAEELVKAYVERIEKIDRAGPRLQSVIALNPDAMAQAKASDARRAKGRELGPLDGVPILLKDNIESLDPTPTTAGAVALADNITGRDSPLVAGLRAAGAVILGKTNLSQWANFRSTNSVSGWSAIGGQVRNPHMLDRSPCGSSSGSGAAVAASLAAGAVGTETNGSISCPAAVNGIVGFKPTVGLVSQRHIVPISASQDTAGPMTKSVRDAALMLGAMDDADVDYVAKLDPGSIAGLRVGVARFAVGSNPKLTALFDIAIADLKAAGAEIIDIEDFELATEDFWGKSGKLLRYEFKAGLNAYLADAAPEVETRDLAELIDFNIKNAGRELAIFDQNLFEQSEEMGGLDDLEYVEAKAALLRATRKDGIDRLLREYDVAVLVSPSGPLASRIDPLNGDTWPDWAGIGYLAAIAGYPHLTVPMGHVHGAPAGISFIGAKEDDARVLSYGHAFELRSQRRPEPRYLTSVEDDAAIAAAMRAQAAQ